MPGSRATSRKGHRRADDLSLTDPASSRKEVRARLFRLQSKGGISRVSRCWIGAPALERIAQRSRCWPPSAGSSMPSAAAAAAAERLGPIVTSGLPGAGGQPRYVIGSVSAAEFLVTLKDLGRSTGLWLGP